MKSHASRKFWVCYQALPPAVQVLALKKFRLWQRDSAQPSLHYKPIGRFWSVRVTRGIRALGMTYGETMI